MNNLDMMRKRFEWQGGIKQEDRMVKDKFRTFQKVLKYSYQGCDVRLVQSAEHCLLSSCFDDEGEYPKFRALINPDKVKQDYDDKIVSIAYDTGFKVGDVFEWCNTGTKWIIYLEEITEDSYFRGKIRRCRYRIKFKDEDGTELATWVAIRGPVETQIDSIQKNQDRIDKPNLSLNILVPLNYKTLRAFDRYKKFLFAGKCWEVQAPDSISMATENGGVLEVNAEENYINRETDDVVREIKDGLIIEPDKQLECGIAGNGFILPKMEETYIVDKLGGKWCIVECKRPVSIVSTRDNEVTIIWNKVVSGQFTLRWTDGQTTLEKLIVVQSLY